MASVDDCQSIDDDKKNTSWIEYYGKVCDILTNVKKLTTELHSSSTREKLMLAELMSNSATKHSIKKCKLFHTGELVDSFITLMKNWDDLVNENWTDTGGTPNRSNWTRIMSTLSTRRRIILKSKCTFNSQIMQFAFCLYDVILLGLRIIAIVGIETLAASQLRMAIIGIVAYNQLLADIKVNYRKKRLTVELPNLVSIQEILSIIGKQRATTIGNILADILMSQWAQNQLLKNENHDSGEPKTLNVSSPDDQFYYQWNIDDELTRLGTIQSQEELNISKLVSVISMTFTDAQQPLADFANIRSRGHQSLQQWWKMDDFQKQEQQGSIINLSNYYHLMLETQLVRTLFYGDTCLRHSPLLSSTHLVDIGDQALKLCIALEDKLSMAKVYRQLRTHLYLEASRKTWDFDMCRALAAAFNSKCTSAVPIENVYQGTRAGQCLVKTLEPLIQLELATIRDEDLNAQSVHDLVFPRLLASLRLTGSWLEMRIRYSLVSWQITTFCLITHSDLKAHILKQTAKMDPDDPEDCDELDVREASLLTVTTWSQINQVITQIQNCSSKCMKEFRRVCSQRIDTELKQSMPKRKEWKQKWKKGIPLECNAYARVLVDNILGSVINGICRLPVPDQISILSISTKVLCEAWMAHILSRQIQFSLHGAQMLKLDFDHLADFLRSQTTLSFEARQSALALEVIRRLRGVANLLLRQNEPNILNIRRRKVAPLPVVSLQSSVVERENGDNSQRMECLNNDDSADSTHSDFLTDEDYVMNKEQWLALRKRASTSDGHRRLPFWCFS